MNERAGRIAAPAAVALFVVVGIIGTEQPLAVALSVGISIVAVCAGLSIGSVSGWPLVAGLAVAAGGFTVICNASPSNLGWFGMCVLAGWCALVTPSRLAIALGGAIAVVQCVEWLVINDDAGGGAWVAGTAFTVILCIQAGRQVDLIGQLREAQAGLAERSRAEERNRIAGEVHDVIGHALTVSLLHVTSARLALDENPDEARTALAEAERLGQQSLAEVRQAVGLLREHHTQPTAPKPDLPQVPELVESFRRAGCDVALHVGGDPRSLTAAAGLTVYRIVQEALTNVARHAPSATAQVRIEIMPKQTRVTVEDDGGGAPARVGDGTGLGVINMRERAQTAGGQLTAGPAGRGWRVQAVLPAVRLEVR